MYKYLHIRKFCYNPCNETYKNLSKIEFKIFIEMSKLAIKRKEGILIFAQKVLDFSNG
jgi:hypothetical protein